MTNNIKQLTKAAGKMPNGGYPSKCDYYRDQIGILCAKNYSGRQISMILSEYEINIHRTTVTRYLQKKPFTDHEMQKYGKEIQRTKNSSISTDEKTNKETSTESDKTVNIGGKKVQRGLTAEELFQKYDARNVESDVEKEINQKLKLMGRKSLFDDD